MDALAIGVGILYLLGGIASCVIIVYLIIKRVNAKKGETFEKRDN
jgi:hypothetical protein